MHRLWLVLQFVAIHRRRPDGEVLGILLGIDAARVIMGKIS